MSAITSSEAGWIDWSSIGPVNDGHVEGLAREVDHPWTELEPRRVEARPAEDRDESAMAAPQLQHPRRGPPILQQRLQPVEAALGQIRSRPVHDGRVAEMLLLVREPVLAPVEVPLLVEDVGDIPAGHLG